MATITVMVDDLTGEQTESVETVAFALEGVEYEIDLSAGNAAKLREALALYVGHARKVSSVNKTAGRRSARPAGDDLNEIRAWARENGYRIADKGRIPVAVMEGWRTRDKSDKPATPVDQATGSETGGNSSAERDDQSAEPTDDVVTAWWTGVLKKPMPRNGKVSAPMRAQYSSEVLGK